MTMGLIYWVLMLIWLVFGILIYNGYAGHYGAIGNTVLLFVLFVLLGWKVFGRPVSDA